MTFSDEEHHAKVKIDHPSILEKGKHAEQKFRVTQLRMNCFCNTSLNRIYKN